MPAIAGGSPEADAGEPGAARHGPSIPTRRGASTCSARPAGAAATVFFGVIPQPLVDWAEAGGRRPALPHPRLAARARMALIVAAIVVSVALGFRLERRMGARGGRSPRGGR